jgi:hypothetical protein
VTPEWIEFCRRELGYGVSDDGPENAD